MEDFGFIIAVAVCITVYQIYKLKHYNVADEIRKLSELEKDGHITKEDFENRKKKLFND